MNKQKTNFFIKSYFYAFEERNISLEKIINRAYLDLCRTLPKVGNVNREKINKGLFFQIKELENKEFDKIEDFDLWHKDNCDKLVDEFRKQYKNFSIGHAQKWVNMILKYCFLLSEDFPNISKHKRFFHCPIDSIVMDIIKKELGIGNIKTPWSKIEDYDVYFNIQRLLREKIKNKSIIEWELEVFNNQ